MTTPRRRSLRIRNDTTPSQCQAYTQTTPLTKVSSLLERDESPGNGATMNIDALVKSPVPSPLISTTYSRSNTMSSPMKTPQTLSRIHPSHEEMHPSKVHQSTIKASSSRLHFGDIDSQIGSSPSKPAHPATMQRTPSKSKGSLPSHMNSPSFDFSFERPETDLSAEAQKIMNSVREEAAKIKAQMIEERSKQEHADGEIEQLYGVGGRKINKPKGKSGRYSDVHKQEFKKMDSIAGHASTWKNKIQDTTSSLKRSPSKAGFDQGQQQLPRSKSFKNFAAKDPHEKLENTSPAKRMKMDSGDDTSSARPFSRDTNASVHTTPKAQHPTGLPSAVTTPTKASLARSASVKSLKTSMIPSLTRSASTKTLKSPAMPKTEGGNKYLSSLSRFGSMKSILHRSQPKFSDDPFKVAAGTHLPIPQKKLDLSKDLPSLPSTSSGEPQRTPTVKHVGFSLTPSGKSRTNLAVESPSPSKIPTPHPYTHPEISTSPPINPEPIIYPNLPDLPNVTTRTPVPKTSAPGDFTFRADKTINFSGTNEPLITSPGSTIRHVRPSGVSNDLPAFDSLPAIPHGMPNKKRSRPDPDPETDDNDENVDPMDTEDADEDQPRAAKKQRMNDPPEKVPVNQASPQKRRQTGVGGSRIPKVGAAKEKGRKGLSIGRLNMLARPKERR